MKYFVYNLLNQRTQIYESEEALIRWFAHRNSNLSWSKKKYNSLFDEIAMNWNDTKSNVVWDNELSKYTKTKISRTLMVFDEYDRIIDPRVFKDKILNYEFTYGGYHYRRYGKYKFRKGPVPGIHRISCHRGSYYRKVKTTQERKMACDREVKPYIRGRRSFRHLTDYWDEIPRNRNHCWKAKKIKKQWMKHGK